MNQHKLSLLFNRFVGREVPLVEREYEIGRDRKKIKQWELLNPNDQTLNEMRKVAQENGLSLRVWWPGINGTADFRYDRANAYIEQDNEGTWRVADKFIIR